MSTAINKGEKQGGPQRQAQGQGGESSRSLQPHWDQERRMAPRSASSLFSLTPRDLMSTSPFELMRRFTEHMDGLFEGTSRGWGTSPIALWSPPIEIFEKDGNLKVCVELPGVSKDDVKVELSEEGLTIRGERKQAQEDQQKGLYRSERSYGSFIRTIPLPDEVQFEKAKATFENGVLTVSVPIPQSTYRRQEIPIEFGTEQSQSVSEARDAAASKEAGKAA